MFEEVAPGFYDFMYAKQLSEYAHGGFGSSIFRTTYSSAEAGTTTMGCEFSADHCTFSLNQIVVILCGWFNHLPLFFPQLVDLCPKEVVDNRLSGLNWLHDGMTQHLKVNPGAKRFYDCVNAMVAV